MQTLSRELRRSLENTVREVRRITETGARKVIRQLAVDNHEPWSSMTLEQRELRNEDDVNQWRTVLFLGVWEQLNNPDFNSLEFEGIRNEAGRNNFFLSAKKWIEATGAVGIYAKVTRGSPSNIDTGRLR